jgi:MFS family permease
MSTFLGSFAMPRPGRAFTHLWLASAVSNLGDGALLAAGPLLLTTLTTDPTAVAAAALAQQLPWLLFALSSGALADRWPRRTLVVSANTARAAVITALTVTIAAGTPTLWLLYLVAFLLGAVETLADAAYGALVADTVPADLLGRANARLHLTFSVNNQLIGPPVGALLFAVATAAPFGLHAAACALAALVVLRVPARPHRTRPRTTIRADIGAGLRFLWHHPGLRTLATCIFVMNLAGVGVFAIWVLYGTQHLGLTDTGYGLFIATGAVGGITGAWAYGRLEKHLGQTVLLRAGLIVEALTYLALALTSTPWVAGLTMAVFGVHAIVWGAVATTARQRATPPDLLGRVGSVYALASVTGSTTGALLGGFLATAFGLLVPFWLAFGLVAVMTVLAWRRLATVRADYGAGERTVPA